MKKLSYKSRFYLLLASLPVVLLMVWSLSFSQTLESFKELRQLKENARMYPNPERTLRMLQDELVQIRSSDPGDHLTIDDQLMSTISENLDRFKIQLEEFPETHLYTSENYRVQTFRIRLSGGFTNLLRFVNYTEYELASCRIVSLAFQREVHRKRGERLYLDLSFQSVFNTRKDEEKAK